MRRKIKAEIAVPSNLLPQPFALILFLGPAVILAAMSEPMLESAEDSVRNPLPLYRIPKNGDVVALRIRIHYAFAVSVRTRWVT